MSVAHVTDEEMHILTERQELTVLKPELKTRPRVHYLGLEKTTTNFLGGNIFARTAAGLSDNVEGATVELILENESEARQLVTDAYGDFKFDGVLGEHIHYTICAHHPKYGSAQHAGTFDTSLYLGPIELAR
jgi:hypothetical protein